MRTLTYSADLTDINGRPLNKSFVLALAMAEIDPACRTESGGRQLRATSKAYGYWLGTSDRVVAGRQVAAQHLAHGIESLRVDLARPNAHDQPPLKSGIVYKQGKGPRLRYWGYWSDWQGFQPDQETIVSNLSPDALLAVADDALGEIIADLKSVHGRMPGLSRKAMIKFLEQLEMTSFDDPVVPEAPIPQP